MVFLQKEAKLERKYELINAKIGKKIKRRGDKEGPVCTTADTGEIVCAVPVGMYD